MHPPLNVRAPVVLSFAVLFGFSAGCQTARTSDNSSPPARPAAAVDEAQRRAAAEREGRAVNAEQLGNTKVTRAEELFIGRFAGVQVFRQPGGGIAVRIRGATSIYGSNEPLYVIDDMIVESGPGGALLGINPADIRRIEVLKDIGSTAFYGVRGANGVVVITTRGSR
jgi:TonB-dependent SusC/RagA subfamily outer membrane receptor